MSVVPAAMIAFILFTAEAAHADIYRYINEEGVECFSDAPATAKAALYLRERAVPPSPRPRKKKEQPTAGTTPPVSAAFPVPGRVTSGVGLRHDPIDGVLRHHQGIDIATPSGTPVRCIAAGRVTFSGTRQGYGKTVVVEHEDGMTTIYAHNSWNLALEGDRVPAAAVIAYSGSTGRSTGPHLHFEAWQGENNVTSTILGIDFIQSPGQVANDGIRRLLGSDGTLIFTNLR